MTDTRQKESFSFKISSVNVTKSAVSAVTEEIVNEKIHFLCSESSEFFGRIFPHSD